MKTRNTYIDLVKGVAIFLVVLGHCIQFGYSMDYYESRDFFENTMFKIIYSFHMPLFALISGYLFYFTLKKRNFFEVIYNRFMTLGIPIITIGSLLFIEKIIGGGYSGNPGIIRMIKDYILLLINPLWFLVAILLCSCCIIVVSKCIKNYECLIYIFIIILFFVTPDSFGLRNMKFLFPFFLLGYLWNKRNHTYSERMYNRKFVIAVTGIVYGILLIGMNYDTYIYTSGFTILGTDNFLIQIYNNLYRFLIGVFGSLFVLMLLKYIDNIKLSFIQPIKELFIQLGRNSLGIYIFQRLLIEEVWAVWFRNNGNSFPAGIVILELFVVLLLCNILTNIVARNKLFNFLILGGRTS